MNIDTARLRQLDLFLWTTIAAAAVVVRAAPLFSDFRLNWLTFALPLGRRGRVDRGSVVL